MELRREKRAILITQYFIENPLPLNRVARIFYPFRSWRLLKRVFSDKNTYTEEDLAAWERIIEKMNKHEKKESE